MQPFQFETTISKGRTLCSKLTWRVAQIGLLLFLMATTFTCSNHSMEENSVESLAFLLSESGAISAQTDDYSFSFSEKEMIVSLESGRQSKMKFDQALTSVEQQEKDQKKSFRSEDAGYQVNFYSKDEKNVAYDLVLEPGVDPQEVRLDLSENEEISITPQGELLLINGDEAIAHTKPYTYQTIDGVRKELESDFFLDGTEVGFVVNDFDPTLPITIDPAIRYVEAEEMAAMFACGITISRVATSGCYYYNDNSYATVSLEVSWTMPPSATDGIAINLDGQFYTLDLSVPVRDMNNNIVGYRTLASPQIVSFEILANGTGGNIDAYFQTDPSCNATSTYEGREACDPNPCSDQAGIVIGGTAFGDNNFDGLLTAGELSRYEGIIVNLYETNSLGETVFVTGGTTTTDIYGDYFFTGLESGKQYRVEFDIPLALEDELRFSTIGTSSFSNVQFVTAPSCGANIALLDPSLYCEPDPIVAIPCFVNGDNLKSGTAASMDAWISYRYTAETYPSNVNVTKTVLATADQIGTVWGVAHNSNTNTLFGASFFRRHSGLGPLGPGGIYTAKIGVPNSVQSFLDLVGDLGINVGQGITPSNASRNLPADFNQPSYDIAAFSLPGKVGLGDIDISANNDTLFVVNVYEKRVYGIDISQYNADGVTKPTVADVVAYPVLDGCDSGAGEFRPWALAYRQGKLYVGGVCDASISGEVSDLRAIIYEINPATPAATPTEIFNFPLTYPKGAPAAPASNAFNTGWYPWTDDYTIQVATSAANGCGNCITYPTPIFTDIDFDLDGAMILGFSDRIGLQWGYFNYRPDVSSTATPEVFAGGDVLRAYFKNGTFILENNAKAGPDVGFGPNNNQGPGNGEFYADNMRFSGTPGFHAELAMGGLAILPGSGEAIIAAVDPATHIRAGGTRKVNNKTGLPSNAFDVYVGDNGNIPVNGSQGTFGKGIGLGDVEIACSSLTRIAIGNYVWYDEIPNGIQDASETPIEGLVVKLYSKTGTGIAEGTLLATTTTGPDGNYQFEGADYDGTQVTWSVNHNIQANAQYYIVFGMGQYNAQFGYFELGGRTYTVTDADQGNGLNQDDFDSDADPDVLTTAIGDLPADMPFICANTVDEGIVKFEYDLGLTEKLDFGDLPEDQYPTTSANNGPYHIIPKDPVVKFGALIDPEADGQPTADADGDDDAGQSDEDGFDVGNTMFVVGESQNITVDVMNMSGSTAKATMFIDWNGDGDFDDTNEMYADSDVQNGETTATFSNVIPPVTSKLNTNIGVRFRISTDMAAVMSPVGRAPDGEVEDYVVQVMGIDYGDLADSGIGTGTGNYQTQKGDNGPSHKIITDENGNYILKIGALLDGEGDGQQNANANGDNSTANSNLNDEDGFNPASQMFITGQSLNLRVPVMNRTDANAKLVLYIDWNNNGTFEAGEMYSYEVLPLETTASFDITPPTTAVLNEPLGLRMRISTDFAAVMSPTGPAPDGEVEDHLVVVMGFDYGDLNDVVNGTGGTPATPTTPADYPTLIENNGAAHKIVSEDGTVTLKIGSYVDDEADGQPSIDAGATLIGDDNNATLGSDPDDEDGLDVNNLPLFILTQTTALEIPVMNMTGSPATIAVFLDFNKDGNFDPNTEKFTATVPNGQVTPVTVNVGPIPSTAVVGQDVGIRIRLANNMNEVMSATGIANSGEVEDYMVQIVGFDYGDLPESYSTTEPNAPKHIVDEDLLLGSCVDSEIDGIPESMAGLMTGGDDDDPGLATFGACEEAGDDEDGIEFVTPMVPGSQACIEVTAVNNKGEDAVLQMWVDWNGDGNFVNGGGIDANEAYSFTIPDGGVDAALYCFDVPTNAIFRDGAAFVRFRLSEAGGLEPDEQTGTVPRGELEDYKLPLGKIGNIVFQDFDFDGVQNVGVEPGIDDVTVQLIWAGADGVIGSGSDDVTYPALTTGPNGTYTFQQGEYYYCGLAPGTYKLIYTTPTNMTPTLDDETDDDIDSDGVITQTAADFTMVMETFTIEDVADLPTDEEGEGDDSPADSGAGNFPNAQTDETHDQGFAFLDYGDLPEGDTPNSNDNFLTEMMSGGAVHVLTPGFTLGTSADGEQEATPTLDASGDGAEDGIVFNTPLIPGNQACVQVTARVPDFIGSAVLQGWIDWDNSGTLEEGEELAFTNDGAINGNITNADFCFTVPQGAAFNDGMVFARFRLRPGSPTDGNDLGPNGPIKYGNDPMPQGEVEDYKLNVAKIGNLVFEDLDFDGAQDNGEPGIEGVSVQLVWGGADNSPIGGADDVYYSALTTAADGSYYYCGLIEGTYKLIYSTPTDMTPTRDNETADDKDSDGIITQTAADFTMVMETFTIEDVTNLPTDEEGLQDDNLEDDGMVGTFPNNQVDETHDQGFAFLDYGDLPEDDLPGNDDFLTGMMNGGAVHVIIPELRLGTVADGDQDGNPSTSANGDDNEGVDDEDGVVFDTPLVPGNQACVKVTTTNNLAAPAVLEAWIDWNGDGDFIMPGGGIDPNEAIQFVSSAVPNGGTSTNNYCFDVPVNARFNDGMVFARFRISPAGGLGPNGPAKYSNDPMPQGEVEDYKLNVGKIGNFVWEDYNYDGLQSADEPGINNVVVRLTWAGQDGDLNNPADNITYNDIQTGSLSPSLGQLPDGAYYFCGLIPGTYKITVVTPDDMTPGRTDGGNEDLDSDGNVMNGDLSMVMTDPIVIEDVTTLAQNETGFEDTGNDDPNDQVGTFPDNQVDERYDFAFNGIDYGDLPDSYSTLDASNGPKHILQPGLYLGHCVDAERDGQPDALAGLRQNGDDNQSTAYTQGTCIEPDDEDGVEFPTPFVPGYEACVEVTYSAEDLGGEYTRDDVFLSAWVDFDGNGTFESTDRVQFTRQDGGAITPTANLPLDKGSDITTRLCFIVPSEATFKDGLIRFRFRLNTETDPEAVTPEGLLVGGEVEDYDPPIAKVGNYTWFDNDLNGDQDFTDAPNTGTHIDEEGVNDVDFVLVWYGEDGIPGNADDRKYIKSSHPGTQGEGEDGIYYFCGLQDGNYRVVPLKYATPANINMNEVVAEDGTVYNITDPDNVSIDGTPTPRYAFTPARKILTRPLDATDVEDSNGAPYYDFSVPDLVVAGLRTGESGNGDLPTVYDFPDTLTELSLDFGWIQEPNIEVLQRIVGVDVPESGVCEHFNVIVDVCVVNSAGAEMDYQMGVPLKNLSLQADLAGQIGESFISLVDAKLIGAGADNNGVYADIQELEYDTTPKAPQLFPTLNPDFDGESQTELFQGDGFIWPGEKVMIRYVFEVAPEDVPMMEGINLTWNVEATGRATNYDMEEIPDFFNNGNQYVTTDLSSDYTNAVGMVLDGTYNDPDEPTNLGDCWKKVNPFAAFDKVHISANGECKVVLDESNLISPYFPECDEGIYPLGGYYRFQIKGTPGIFFKPTEVDASSIVNGEITYQIFTVNRKCQPEWGNLLLEDKTGPTVVPPAPVMLDCWLVDDVLNVASTVAPLDISKGKLGIPVVTDGCDGTPLDYAWNDVVEYFNCREDGVTAIITRTFTAIDEQGNLAASASQTITFKAVPISDFAFKADTDASDGLSFQMIDGKWTLLVNSCTPQEAVTPSVYPVYVDDFGNERSLDEGLCYLTAEDAAITRFEICGDGYKEEHEISVLDWCVGRSSVEFRYLVKVGDFEAPRLSEGSCAQATIYASESALLEALNNGTAAIDTSKSCGMISSGPMDCTAAINTSLSALEARFGDLIEDCNDNIEIAVDIYSYLPETINGFETGDTFWMPGNYATQGTMFMGIPAGTHIMHINVSDECYNASSFVIVFNVMDLNKPVMKCDDELRVTLVEGDLKLGINGYAQATIDDVDEGSWDNCELVDMKVRREISGDAAADYQKKYETTQWTLDGDDDGVLDAYTPWRGIVDFFCADVTEIGDDDGGVRVELWGIDRKGNTSICWATVEVENGTNLGLDLVGEDAKITCEEYREYLTDGGEFDPSDFAEILTVGNNGLTGCSAPSASLKYELDLDQCDFGWIYITIDQESVVADPSKNYIDTDQFDTVKVQVVAVHDYWIKFPQDTKVTCAAPEESGVEVYAGACDLLTVYENDELFESTQDPDACYKIFRTYQVINWCEYDGQHDPIIVSRDWDSWNGTDCAATTNPDRPYEYNLNPRHPDGDDQPGNTDLYVIVKRDYSDMEVDRVYYDSDEDPFSNSGAVSADDPNTEDFEETYWWQVTSAEFESADKMGNDWEGYYWQSYRCTKSVWASDKNQYDSDLNGTPANDDDDYRYGSFGFWQYTQHIIVYDDSKPEVSIAVEDACSIDGEDCNADASFTISIADTCSTVGITVTAVVTPGNVVVELTGNADNTEFTGTAAQLDLGTYTITATVNDGCGNITVVTEEFEVKDCKGPAPICHDGLVVELMPTDVPGEGMAAVWATDYVASDIYDCTALSNDANGYGIVPETAYSIYFVDSLDANVDGEISEDEFPTEAQLGVTLTCGDKPMRTVAIFAKDEAGNQDYCITFVEVQDNNNACDSNAPTGDIAGLISTEDVFPIEGTEVQLSGGRSMMYMTSDQGDYTFEEVAQGYDYSITPFKDQDHSNGVSTFDLILIQKHILGTTLLDSPYKLIAADANNSKSITTLDLIQVRKLILNVDTEFSNNTSWRFVDADYKFPDPTNPWKQSFPEIKNINNLSNRLTLANFVGVKIGDVNGSARANTAQAIAARSVTDVMEIRTAEVEMKQGNVYTIHFDAHMDDIAGYQFTLDLDQAVVELVDVEGGIAKSENFGIFASEGVITTSFHRTEGEEIEGSQLFSITLKAKTDVALSEVIGISSRFTAAEAYATDANGQYEDLAIGLVVGEGFTESEYVLYQNRPNPFQAETVISFKLPEAMEAVIELKDISGRTVLLTEGDYTKGYNEMRLKAEDLPAAGVYFYTLHAGEFKATKKLVMIRQ